jgi:signal transduction histidine kinase
VLFQPLRDRMERAINRLMYGERDDPYAVISRLGQRLEATITPDAVLPTIVHTIRDALKLPYVAIGLTHDGETEIVAEAGNRETGGGGDREFEASSPFSRLPLSLSLTYQHETVGELLLAPRSADESFSAADQRLLDDLARQAGIAVHAVQLTHDMQRSRERIISAREEERRRLRRDLHDGLGPTLASLTMKLETAEALVVRDLPEGVALLRELQGQMKHTIGNVRRLVYGLRPPILDQFGLVGALREQALQIAPPDLRVQIDAPGQLPPLPAAVEVAAYYIVVEALTNVARHAHARQCTIRLSLDEMLRIEIADDGIGLPLSPVPGVGLQSIRERAAELRGTCVIAPNQPHGTIVCATLPL